MADNDITLIDDRSNNNLVASSGPKWRLVSDGVMGGVSSGELSVEEIGNRRCLQLKGNVRLDNNGGFIQAAIDLDPKAYGNIADYSGILLAVHGNGEEYNVHLRTSNLWLPWQSYRASFISEPEWEIFKLPFSEFLAYRTNKPLNIEKLSRIGIVAIGREFQAELCIGRIGFY